MDRIPLEDTPIYTQLARESAAKAAYEHFFGEPATEPAYDE